MKPELWDAAPTPACRAARQRAESDAPLSPELKAKMEQLPEGREELGARRGEVEREMARSACHDEGLVARFEREQRDIDERTKLVGCQGSMGTCCAPGACAAKCARF
jgi:hypothetical protein